MAYLSAKKIYPADMAEPLNGWYQNISTTGGTQNNASKVPDEPIKWPVMDLVEEIGIL